jgi:hypothetical protein
MFVTLEKVKLDTEHIRGLSLATVKQMPVQVARQLHELGHDLICQA